MGGVMEKATPCSASLPFAPLRVLGVLCEKTDCGSDFSQRRKGLAKAQRKTPDRRHLVRSSLAPRFELERRRQDAVTPSGIGMRVPCTITVLENVPKVRIALTAKDFRSIQSVGRVGTRHDGFRNRRPEARPSRRRLELVLGSEQRMAASRAHVKTGPGMLREAALGGPCDHRCKRHSDDTRNRSRHND